MSVKKKARILIADDEKNILDAITRILEPDYDIVPARTGDEALELFKAGSYELVISDIKMPGIDGVDLFREIRALKPGQKFVFVSVSSLFYDDPDIQRIFSKEADGFLGKPYRIEELLSLIERVLKR